MQIKSFEIAAYYQVLSSMQCIGMSVDKMKKVTKTRRLLKTKNEEFAEYKKVLLESFSLNIENPDIDKLVQKHHNFDEIRVKIQELNNAEISVEVEGITEDDVYKCVEGKPVGEIDMLVDLLTT